MPTRAESASFETSTLPRASSASLEASTPLGRGPPRSRAQPAPSGDVRLARGLNAPSARTVSLEGTCTHVVHAPAPVYGHLML
jgi:hypothetical protein